MNALVSHATMDLTFFTGTCFCTGRLCIHAIPTLAFHQAQAPYIYDINSPVRGILHSRLEKMLMVTCRFAMLFLCM